MIKYYIFIMILLMVIVPTILLFALKKHQKTLKITAIVLFVIFFSLLFIGTTFRIYIKNDNLVIYPDFSQKWFSLKFLAYNFSVTNILINLALLFPVGFIVYIFTNKNSFIKTIITALLISVFIEFYQFALPVARTTELTDILFNTISGVISALYCLVLKKLGAFKK